MSPRKWKGKDLDSLPSREKIRRSRRSHLRKDIALDFEQERSRWPDLIAGTDLFAARVVEVHKRYVFISPEPEPLDIATRDVWLATIPRRLLQAGRLERNFCSVGDEVLCLPAEENPSEELPCATVEYRAPRYHRLCRLDPMSKRREHVLATNVDQWVVVASYLYPTIKWGLIDRYIVLAEEEGVKLTIILNKEDLLKEESKEFQEHCQSMCELYRSLGYDILSLSAHTISPRRRASLRSLFQGKISLLSGHSGVGKSTLVNLLGGQIEQLVEDQQILTKGRHTTSYASLIALTKLSKAYVIDTPGIRSFMLSERSGRELATTFVEMRPLMDQCQYRECRHYKEPHCAVRQAVQEGQISRTRYQSYLAILLGASSREGRLGTQDSLLLTAEDYDDGYNP